MKKLKIIYICWKQIKPPSYNIQIIDQWLISIEASFSRLIFLIYTNMIANNMQKNDKK